MRTITGFHYSRCRELVRCGKPKDARGSSGSTLPSCKVISSEIREVGRPANIHRRSYEVDYPCPQIADAIPKGPVYVTIDHELPEQKLDAPMEISHLSKFESPSKMAPDQDAIGEAANRLITADMPVIPSVFS